MGESDRGAGLQDAAAASGPARAVVRLVVRVDDGWTVTVACPDHAVAWAQAWTLPPRSMARLEDPLGGAFPAGRLHAPGEPHQANAPADPVEAIAAAYASIVDRANPQIEAFGHYLFDALLGPDLWAAMAQFAEASGADLLDLALALPATDASLHRLPWEMMRGPSVFVAAGVWNGQVRKLSVAITRRVEGRDDLTVTPVASPPSVLFVVGTDVSDEKIRPGAEMVGLLRRLRSDRSIRHRLLERASIWTLKQTVAAFRPDVVHFICHGGIRPESGAPYLELRTDAPDEDPRRSAGQLVNAIEVEGMLPTVVVLSACYTSDRGEYLPAGADKVVPMATAFIQGGVPIVVGMSGRVNDMTCRLFTRRFGQSIVAGEPLVEATAVARMATFVEGQDPLLSPDWALPTVFLASGVAAGAAPFPPPVAGDEVERFEAWVTGYSLRQDPVFSGRETFFDKFRDVLRGRTGAGRAKPVLAIYADEHGLGASRLLKELAIAALQDGHVPVRIAPAPGQAPATLDDFARRLAGAIDGNPICSGDGTPLQLDMVRDIVPGAPLPEKLDPDVRSVYQREQKVSPKVVALAARRDLASLHERAARAYPRFASAGSRVVVLLDDVDLYGTELIRQLMAENDGLLTEAGLGTPEWPVPLVFTYHRSETTASLVGGASEPRTRSPWTEVVELTRMEDRENLLACELVLLNPYAPDLYPDDGLSVRPWTLVELPGRVDYAFLRNVFRRTVGGIPYKLAGDSLYTGAAIVMDNHALVEADDEVWLAKVVRPRAGP